MCAQPKVGTEWFAPSACPCRSAPWQLERGIPKPVWCSTPEAPRENEPRRVGHRMFRAELVASPKRTATIGTRCSGTNASHGSAQPCRVFTPEALLENEPRQIGHRMFRAESVTHVPAAPAKQTRQKQAQQSAQAVPAPGGSHGSASATIGSRFVSAGPAA